MAIGLILKARELTRNKNVLLNTWEVMKPTPLVRSPSENELPPYFYSKSTTLGLYLSNSLYFFVTGKTSLRYGNFMRS